MAYGDEELGFRESLSKAIFGGLTAQQMGKIVKDTVDINHDGKMDEVEAQALGAHTKLRIEETNIPQEKEVLSKIKDIPDQELIDRYKAIGVEVSPEAVKALKTELSSPLDRAAAEQKQQEAIKKSLDRDGDGVISKDEAEKNKLFLQDIAGAANNLSDAQKAEMKANPQSVVEDIQKRTGLTVSPEAGKIFTDTALEAANKPKKPGAAEAKEEDWWMKIIEMFAKMLGIDLGKMSGHGAETEHTAAAATEHKKPQDPAFAGLDPAILAQISKEGRKFKEMEIAYANSPEAASVKVQTVVASGASKDEAARSGFGV